MPFREILFTSQVSPASRSVKTSVLYERYLICVAFQDLKNEYQWLELKCKTAQINHECTEQLHGHSSHLKIHEFSYLRGGLKLWSSPSTKFTFWGLYYYYVMLQESYNTSSPSGNCGMPTHKGEHGCQHVSCREINNRNKTEYGDKSTRRQTLFGMRIIFWFQLKTVKNLQLFYWNIRKGGLAGLSHLASSHLYVYLQVSSRDLLKVTR
jgi:hypothetical protein